MPGLRPIFTKAYWSLAALGTVYAVFLLCLTNSSVQTNALYAHRFKTADRHSLKRPDSAGFGKNQATPFSIRTPDGEELYGWHVLPLSLYAANEAELQQQEPLPLSNLSETRACKLLLEDPDARVVINFHGNAGHIAQGFRPAIYRSLTSASQKIHVFTIDYRGFGFSTGIPSEAGLITDGVTLVDYILNLGIPPYRIILLGQSLGTAVASAVGLHYADPATAVELLAVNHRNIGFSAEDKNGVENIARNPHDFAAIVLVASFSSLPKLILKYRIFGIIPILSPLRGYPRIQNFLTNQIQDTWKSLERLTALAKAASQRSGNLRLHILHARDDWEISYIFSEEIFQAADEALTQHGMEGKGVRSSGELGKTRKKEVWLGDDKKILLMLEILRYGGHNRIATDVPVVIAVLKGFQLM